MGERDMDKHSSEHCKNDPLISIDENRRSSNFTWNQLLENLLDGILLVDENNPACQNIKESSFEWTYQNNIGNIIHLEITPLQIYGRILLRINKKTYEIDNNNEKSEIIDMVFKDKLTKLYNRSYFIEKLNNEVENRKNSGKKMTVIFMDLDNFKKLNNALGYNIGDKALIYFSHKLKSIIGDRGIISRIGGDEFSILLPEITKIEDAMNISNEIIDGFSKQTQIDSHSLFITASIGISIYPNDGQDTETLMKNADIAMNEAKKQVRRKAVLYSPDFYEQIRVEFIIDNYLRNALVDNEFYLDYQPIVEASTGRVVGAEALLRWQQPELGLVSPDSFIKIAEGNRTILDIGKWVFKTVCQQIKKLSANGIDSIFISLNVSIVQLEQDSFSEWIKETIERYSIPPKLLIIEITETSLMENLEKVKREIEKIRSLGIRVAIDDFGTGYSSLGQIKKLHINDLKVDKIFINDIGDKASDIIVSAIISISKNLNMEVIAEGVETKEQLDFLKNLNCDMVQGYLFSKPVTSEKLELLVKNKYPF
jgi:diguanylate cyclase (GGDEF)-like protein